MAKVFVTGGNGLIGQWVAAALKRRGYSVSALIRDESQKDELLKLEITPVVG
jgi:nucleoside-diphosphate-sugar epimerase